MCAPRLRPTNWCATATRRRGLSRKHLFEGLKASLQRFGLEYVDCVFCHSIDAVTPSASNSLPDVSRAALPCRRLSLTAGAASLRHVVEEVVRAFNVLIDMGLCFYWGTSCVEERLQLVTAVRLFCTAAQLHGCCICGA